MPTLRPETVPEPVSLPTPSGAETAQGPIELVRLSHDYGNRVALDNLSFNVREGEIFGLLGPNGSGKTTLFRILSTLMLPSSGHARIQGFDAATSPAQVRQRIGIVFQARSVDLKLTVEENLRHQGHLYGLRAGALSTRIAEVLARVGLADRAHEAVETLSGGMQRRVELAKGLIHSPSLLLLDEPSTGLDPGARRDLWIYLRALRDEEHVTVFVTTHLMEEAGLCDRLAILNTGRLVALGTPDALKSSIGGEVVLLEASGEDEARGLAGRVARAFAIETTALGATVRIERPDGAAFVTQAIAAFPGEIVGFSVARPTLEDVFIQRTGHRFWNAISEPSGAPRSKKGH